MLLQNQKPISSNYSWMHRLNCILASITHINGSLLWLRYEDSAARNDTFQVKAIPTLIKGKQPIQFKYQYVDKISLAEDFQECASIGKVGPSISYAREQRNANIDLTLTRFYGTASPLCLRTRLWNHFISWCVLSHKERRRRWLIFFSVMILPCAWFQAHLFSTLLPAGRSKSGQNRLRDSATSRLLMCVCVRLGFVFRRGRHLTR